jgi:UDP-4-amino-4,6-dideoxy-N-acetyl-beta-L-altrosamine transaminase
MPEGFLNYGRQAIGEDDIAAVVDVLRGDWLTTGPAVERFEAALSEETGAEHAVVCNSGTAALFLATRAAGLKPGDSVIVPAMTFAATASANVLAGVEVIFSDVDPLTGLMRVADAEEALARRGRHQVKGVLPVHLTGRVSDPAALLEFAEGAGLVVIEDACHALGTRYGNARHAVGSCEHSLAACFSFHPVKAIAMGEGGAVTTNSKHLADEARLLRNHGMSRSPDDFQCPELALAPDGAVNPWYYEVAEISHNLRASDINCALAASQLRKLDRFLNQRRALMERYRVRLAELAPVITLAPWGADLEPGWHLCAVQIDFESLQIDRRTLMLRLRERGIGTQVHYLPVNLHPFYRNRYGEIDLPGALSYYQRTLSLPLYPTMTSADVDRVVDELAACIAR